MFSVNHLEVTMKKKLVIELFVYIILVLIGLVVMVFYKPSQPDIIIPNDFEVERGSVNDLVYFE